MIFIALVNQVILRVDFERYVRDLEESGWTHKEAIVIVLDFIDLHLPIRFYDDDDS